MKFKEAIKMHLKRCKKQIFSDLKLDERLTYYSSRSCLDAEYLPDLPGSSDRIDIVHMLYDPVC